jgi:hypothetical protein
LLNGAIFQFNHFLVKDDEPLLGFSGFVRENQPSRQNWGKIKAHKWGGFTGRLK